MHFQIHDLIQSAPQHMKYAERNLCYHFTDEKTETENSEMICPWDKDK